VLRTFPSRRQASASRRSTPSAASKAAAGGKDIRIGGGVATIRQYLRAGLIDELYLAISPVLLGKGENLLEGLDTRALGYECHKHVAGGRAAAHVFLRKRGLSAL